MNPGLTLALAALVAGFATYWFFVFRRLLPLDRELRAVRERAGDLRRFALEVLELHLSTGTAPHALNEMGQRCVVCLHQRLPELALCWVRRAGGTDEGIMVAARGRVWSELGQDAWDFGSALLRQASEEGGLTKPITGAGAGGKEFRPAGTCGTSDTAGARGSETDPLLRLLADHGFCVLRLIPWGRSGSSEGLLVAADRDPRGAGLQAAEPFLDIVRRLATSLAEIVDGLVRLSQASERLQGGLTSAIEELTHTHTRLIEKAREVRTLHDVAEALISRGAKTESLGAIVSIVAKYLQADLVAFLLFDEETQELVTQAGAYGLEGEEQFYRMPLSRDDASSVRVYRTRRPFLTGDAQSDPNVIAHYAKLWKVHSLMVIPLLVEERCIGVMRVGSFQKDYFSGEQVEMMTIIAEEAAVIVETAILNRKLSQVAEQLANLNRMKSDFVSTVSHEFKTPLTSLSGFLDVLLSGEAGPLSAQQQEFLRISEAQVKRLASLVSDLLDCSRLEANMEMAKAAVALEAVVRASVANHSLRAGEAGKTITVEASAPVPEVVGDAKWLGLAVDNLISNAVKFTRPGGRVAVSLSRQGETVEVCVADDGIGIHPDDQSRIFEKFFRARNRSEISTPGTGLGLTIAKEVVSRHGGRIWFQSEPGKGTRFCFALPLQPAAAGAGD
ncbi:MAG: GAF domain-containing sensor histidine kinase [Elusimicrobia bacterium]|nr:GAF domain-containing sensor histidine kinase [Elusimicrobiota bacterium]